jgi:hypothetical protein
LVNNDLRDLPADEWRRSLSDRGPRTGKCSESTHQNFRRLGIAPRSVFSLWRTPNDTLRARTLAPAASAGVDALFDTLKSQPVYPGYFADVPTAVTYFTGF